MRWRRCRPGSRRIAPIAWIVEVAVWTTCPGTCCGWSAPSAVAPRGTRGEPDHILLPAVDVTRVRGRQARAISWRRSRSAYLPASARAERQPHVNHARATGAGFAGHEGAPLGHGRGARTTSRCREYSSTRGKHVADDLAIAGQAGAAKRAACPGRFSAAQEAVAHAVRLMPPAVPIVDRAYAADVHCRRPARKSVPP